MTTRKERKEFEPRVIGEAFFASNGDNPGKGDMHFRIIQVTIGGGCVVEQKDVEGNWQKQNHTRTPEKAWSSIKYQAGITFYTERSLGAPETDPLPKFARPEPRNRDRSEEESHT